MVFNTVLTKLVLVLTLSSILCCTVYCLPQEWEATVNVMKAELKAKMSNITFLPSDPIIKTIGCQSNDAAEWIYGPGVGKHVSKLISIRNRYADDYYSFVKVVRQQKKMLRDLERKILEEKALQVSDERQSLIPKPNPAMEKYHEAVVELDKMIVVLNEKIAVFREVAIESKELMREYQLVARDIIEQNGYLWFAQAVGVVSKPVLSFVGRISGYSFNSFPEAETITPRFFNWCEQ